MSARWPDAASCVEGAAGMVSPLRMIGAGAAGGIGGSGVANGVPISQSHNERLSGRRARPSHDGGAFDQIAQPPSCDAITQMMSSRRHIFRNSLFYAGAFCPRSFGYATVVPCDRVRRKLPPCRLALTAARPRLADQRAPA